MLAGRLRGGIQSTTSGRFRRVCHLGHSLPWHTLIVRTIMGSNDVKTQRPASDEERRRAAAEAVRESAERGRAEAEAARAAAERARLTAEQARAAAEATRAKSVAEVGATAEGLTAILDEMKAVETMRRARRTMKDSDGSKTH